MYYGVYSTPDPPPPPPPPPPPSEPPAPFIAPPPPPPPPQVTSYQCTPVIYPPTKPFVNVGDRYFSDQYRDWDNPPGGRTGQNLVDEYGYPISETNNTQIYGGTSKASRNQPNKTMKNQMQKTELSAFSKEQPAISGIPAPIWDKIVKAKTSHSYTEAGVLFQKDNEKFINGMPILGGQYIAEICCTNEIDYEPAYLCKICPKIMTLIKLRDHLQQFLHSKKYILLRYPELQKSIEDMPKSERKTKIRELSHEIVSEEGLYFPELRLDLKLSPEEMLAIFGDKNRFIREGKIRKLTDSAFISNLRPDYGGNSARGAESRNEMPMELQNDDIEYDFEDTEESEDAWKSHILLLNTPKFNPDSSLTSLRQENVISGQMFPLGIIPQSTLAQNQGPIMTQPNSLPELTTMSGVHIPARIYQDVIDARAFSSTTRGYSELINVGFPVVGANQVAEICTDRPDFQPIYFCRICPNFCILEELKQHLLSEGHQMTYLERFHPSKYCEMSAMNWRTRKSWLNSVLWKVQNDEASKSYPSLALDYKMTSQDAINIWGEFVMLNKDARKTNKQNAINNQGFVMPDVNQLKQILKGCQDSQKSGDLPNFNCEKVRGHMDYSLSTQNAATQNDAPIIKAKPTPLMSLDIRLEEVAPLFEQRKLDKIENIVWNPPIGNIHGELLRKVLFGCESVTITKSLVLNTEELDLITKSEQKTAALIGGRFLVEFLCENQQWRPVYFCKMCRNLSRLHKTFAHLASLKHRIRYLKDKFPGHYKIMKSMHKRNRPQIIENVSLSVQAIEKGPLLPNLKCETVKLNHEEIKNLWGNDANNQIDVNEREADEIFSDEEFDEIDDLKEFRDYPAASFPEKITQTLEETLPELDSSVRKVNVGPFTESEHLILKCALPVIGCEDLIEIQCENEQIYRPVYFCFLCRRYMILKGVNQHLISDGHRTKTIRYKCDPGSASGNLNTVAGRIEREENGPITPYLRSGYKWPVKLLLEFWPSDEWPVKRTKSDISVRCNIEAMYAPHRNGFGTMQNNEDIIDISDEQDIEYEQNDTIIYSGEMKQLQCEEAEPPKNPGKKRKKAPLQIRTLKIPVEVFEKMKSSKKMLVHNLAAERAFIKQCHVQVGLKQLVEFKLSNRALSPLYWCQVCGTLAPVSRVRYHLCAKGHRQKYLEVKYPRYYFELMKPENNETLNKFGKELDRLSRVVEREEKIGKPLFLHSNYVIPSKVAIDVFGFEALRNTSEFNNGEKVKLMKKPLNTVDLPKEKAPAPESQTVFEPAPVTSTIYNNNTPTNSLISNVPLVVIDASVPPPGIEMPNLMQPPPQFAHAPPNISPIIPPIVDLTHVSPQANCSPPGVSSKKQRDPWKNKCDDFLSKIGALPKNIQGNFLPVGVESSRSRTNPTSAPSVDKSLQLEHTLSYLSDDNAINQANDDSVQIVATPAKELTKFAELKDPAVCELLLNLELDLREEKTQPQPLELTLCSVLNYGHRPPKRSQVTKGQQDANQKKQSAAENIKQLIMNILS